MPRLGKKAAGQGRATTNSEEAAISRQVRDGLGFTAGEVHLREAISLIRRRLRNHPDVRGMMNRCSTSARESQLLPVAVRLPDVAAVLYVRLILESSVAFSKS